MLQIHSVGVSTKSVAPPDRYLDNHKNEDTDMNMITLQISGQQIHIDPNLNAGVDLRPDGLYIRATQAAEPVNIPKNALKVRAGKPSRVKIYLERVKAGMDPIEICRSTIITL
jgi:hypothetical protein